MKILWVPHHPFGVTRTRTEHLVERLAGRMEIHVLNFVASASLRAIFGTGNTSPEAFYQEHFLPRLPRLNRLNGHLLTRAVLRLHQEHDFDVVVISPNQYMIGELDFSKIPIPVICDYLDGADWRNWEASGWNAKDGYNFERDYVEKADAVLCISRMLETQARTVNANVHYVPNGVELDRYLNTPLDRFACKKKLGLRADACTVSLIGLTCSPSLYFVDAVKQLASEGMAIELVLVGDGAIREEIRRRSRGLAYIHDAGPIPYRDVLEYFVATDIGLYPADDISYFHFATPLKVFEYAALGRHVIVSPELAELKTIDLRNVSYCAANAESLAKTIARLAATTAPAPDPKLADYDWARIAAACGDVIADVAAQGRT